MNTMPFRPLETVLHAVVAAFWCTCCMYALIEIEHDRGDLLIAMVLFVSGVCACAQAFLLLTEAEEIVCR